ncbi:MAG TPA: dTDP-glucose 4,6-dehydratase [Bauldia sp.]|nr:dTDP-glucose 4,6-dehydratase [Bauldia sp.]
MKIMVTGGAGFIGSAVCRHLIGETAHSVVNLDKLTYSANLDSLKPIANSDRYLFVKYDIADTERVLDILRAERVDAILHLAAESHVDRSIAGPAAFVHSNVVGTFALLEAARLYFEELPEERRERFRFHHVSTDEVYGDLPFDGGIFREDTPYRPSSPYAASKAASDHFALAWHHTYGLPVIVSNCSNNFGPRQFPEKLIPRMIVAALAEKPLPVYGDGANVRDWIHVEDHVRALVAVLTRGRVGERYNIGARNERSNLAVVEMLCAALDRKRPRAGGRPHADLITFVADRRGHDLRYAIDPGKVEAEMGWRPQRDFEKALDETVAWYIANEDWWRPLTGRTAGEGSHGI